MKTNLRDTFKKALYENRLARQQTVEIKSGYNFLNQLNGFKRGSVSVVLGTTSSGKSTFMRSIILDALRKNKFIRIACYLSEETIGEYSLEIFKATRGVEFEERVKIYSEQDCRSDEEKAGLLKKAFTEKSDLLIFDNVTTSALYDGQSPQHQSKFSNKMKAYAKETSKALICVAHTSGSVGKRMNTMITSSDIRGSKSLGNIAEFFYIIHQMETAGRLMNYVQIEKHRGQSPDNKFFILNYDRVKNIYGSDTEVTFVKFKEGFKGRDKL